MTKIFGDKTTEVTVVDTDNNAVNLDVAHTEQLLDEIKLNIKKVEARLSLVTDHEIKEGDLSEE